VSRATPEDEAFPSRCTPYFPRYSFTEIVNRDTQQQKTQISFRKQALKADKRQEDQKTSSTRRLRLPSYCLVIAAQALAGIMEGRSR
jgi:hypothetical protein